MDVKTRRNLPLLIIFIALVTFLVLGLGNQPIVAYTLEQDGSSYLPDATLEVQITNDTSSPSWVISTTDSADSNQVMAAPTLDVTESGNVADTILEEGLTN